MLVFFNLHQYMWPKILKTHLPRLLPSNATEILVYNFEFRKHEMALWVHEFRSLPNQTSVS